MTPRSARRIVAPGGGCEQGGRMDRRRGLRCAVGLIAGAAASPVLQVLAQPREPLRRVGVLVFGGPTQFVGSERETLFKRGLREHGFVEGENIAIEWRHAHSDEQRLQDAVTELLRLPVDLIVATSTLTCQAAQRQTATVPIVITSTADPVGDGFALSLARPGKNITGMSTSAAETIQKSVELLGLLDPRPRRIAVLANPLNRANAPQLESVRAAGRATGMAVVHVSASRKADLPAAYETAARERVGAILIFNDGLFYAERQALAQMGRRERLPTMFGFRDGAEAGMLLSYGPNIAALFHRSASFVARILRGAAPGDLPFEQPTIFELVLNRDTARAIGVPLPQALLMRADEVIE